MGDYFTSNGTCEPAALCSVNTTTNHSAKWLIPSLTAPLTITYDVVAPSPTVVTSLWGTTDGWGCSGTCPPTVAMKRPTVTSKVTYTPSGIVMPGDTLHFVVGAAANIASPNSTYPECVTTSAGLGVPTNVQATLTVPSWNPYLGGVCGTVPPFETTRVVWVAFDCVVTGAVGSDVTVHGANLDGIGEYVLVNQSLKIHIGPVSTPVPKPAPQPTPSRTIGVSAQPTVSGPSAPPVSPTEPEPTLGSSAPAPSASPNDASVSSTEPAAVESVPPSQAVATDSPRSPSVALLIVLFLVVALTLAAVRFRRSRSARGAP
jgi:hypothetical protein